MYKITLINNRNGIKYEIKGKNLATVRRFASTFDDSWHPFTFVAPRNCF